MFIYLSASVFMSIAFTIQMSNGVCHHSSFFMWVCVCVQMIARALCRRCTAVFLARQYTLVSCFIRRSLARARFVCVCVCVRVAGARVARLTETFSVLIKNLHKQKSCKRISTCARTHTHTHTNAPRAINTHTHSRMLQCVRACASFVRACVRVRSPASSTPKNVAGAAVRSLARARAFPLY